MRGLRWMPATVAVVATIGLPGAAQAAGGFEYVQRDRTIQANGSASRTVRCPRHTRSVGGGVYITGTSLEVEVSSSFPLDYSDHDGHGDDGWVGSGNAGPSMETMTVTAICAKRGTLSYARSHFKDVKPGRRGHATARCPNGTQAIGGGVSTAGDSLNVVTLAGSVPLGVSDGNPDNDRWKGYATNASPNHAELAAYATCAKHVQTTSVSVSGGPPLANGAQSSLATNPCPANHYVTGGGGVIIGHPAGTEIATLAPVGEDTWRTYFNNQSGADQEMSVSEVCTKLQ